MYLSLLLFFIIILLVDLFYNHLKSYVQRLNHISADKAITSLKYVKELLSLICVMCAKI